MGYYSTITNMPKIEKVKELREAYKKLKEERKEEIARGIGETPISFIDYFDFEVTDEGHMEFAEYTGKFYDTDRFAVFLAPYVKSGMLEFDGEDGDSWGYHFKNGKAYHVYWVRNMSNDEVKI